MRRFELQLYYSPEFVKRRAAWDHDRETRLLVKIAAIVDSMLGWAPKHTTPSIGKTLIRHDGPNFYCYVVPADEKRSSLITVARRVSALHWTETERQAFAYLLATTYRKRFKGPPLITDNFDPRSMEDTAEAGGVEYVIRE